MSIYSIEFKALSVLTKIPNAQTIFGAFCYKFKEMFGNEKLEEFLNDEKSNNPVVLFSSMFYKDVLPFPQDFCLNYKKGITLKETNNNKKIKKIKYISKSIYIDYVNNKIDFENNFQDNLTNKYKIVNEVLLKNGENIIKDNYIIPNYRTRNAFSLDENEKSLYKDEVLYCDENLSFTVYINILNEKYKKEILNTFLSMKYVFFGGKKSIGYNLYSYIGYKEEKELEKKRHNLLISKSLITNNIDFETSFYNIERITNKNNIQSNKLYRKQVVVFNEGSVIKTDDNFIGHLIEEEINGKTIYQYYLGMMI